jgi:hypothetical protein
MLICVDVNSFDLMMVSSVLIVQVVVIVSAAISLPIGTSTHIRKQTVVGLHIALFIVRLMLAALHRKVQSEPKPSCWAREAK